VQKKNTHRKRQIVLKIGIYISDILFRTGGTEANCAYIIYALQYNKAVSEITVVSEIYKNTEYKYFNIINHLNFIFGLNIKNDNIGINFIYANKTNFISRAIFKFKLRKFSKNYDIFINCSMNLFYFSAKSNIAIIHFPPYRKTSSGFVRKYPFFYFTALINDRYFSRTYSLYISYSKYVNYWLNKIWHIDESRAVLINPAVNLINKNDEPKQAFIFICSRIEKSKDIDVLVSAYKSSDLLKNTCKLIIAGAVISETISYLQVLKSLIVNNTDLITIHENPAYNEITDYYRKATVFWHAKGYSAVEEDSPSDLEHFGISTVEAMSAGCVPVVINKGGQKEIIDNGINGFLWNTPDELVKNTIYLLQNKEECNKISQFAVEKAKNYSLEKFIRNFNEALNSIL
jgi:glycosyltransferase involved in cell wall biosynthesis